MVGLFSKHPHRSTVTKFAAALALTVALLVPMTPPAYGTPIQIARPSEGYVDLISARNTQQGGVNLVLEVNFSGTVSITELRKYVQKKGSNKKVKSAQLAMKMKDLVVAEGRVSIPITPTPNASKSLKKGKTLKPTFLVVFTPDVYATADDLVETVTFKLK